ncbi:MAG: putative extracellular solute-binding protein [Subtercola sp.]|jgi:NitT/TauT family transport system substrate-binding protein|nr:putative extracellular solute-binding protein [Subtercola sp.]
MKRFTASIAGAVGVLTVTAALAGCSSSSGDSSSASTPQSTGPVSASIVVGVGGQLSNADVFSAIADGYFAKQDLTATTTILTAGSNAIPQLLSGDLTFAAVDTTTAINATQQNVGITTVSPNTIGVPGKVGYAMVTAGANSGINSAKDLEGKKVQVNQLGGTAQVLTEASVQADGGDPSKVQFVEIAPPQALAALQSGQVDAAVLGEPNVTAAVAAGFKAVFNPEETTVPNLPTFVFVTSTDFANKNPEVVKEFQNAILASHTALNADPAHLREIAATSTQVPAAVLAQVQGLPLFGADPITGDQVQSYIDLLVKFGALQADAVPKGDAVVWQG